MFARNALVSTALCLVVGGAFAQSGSVGYPTGGPGSVGSPGYPIPVDPRPLPNTEPRYDLRNIHEHDRIQEGIANGTLTRAEAERLRSEQHYIRYVEQRDARNGISAREQAQINRLQDHASRDIYWQKHDAQNRYNNGRP